jgi:LysM repeat protein
MVQPRKALLRVEWSPTELEDIHVQYNPTDLSFEKSVQYAEVTIPGLDAPLQQYVRGQAEKLTVDLFYDTTDQGMGPGATSVTAWTDKIYQLTKVHPELHAPPRCTFLWSEHFPGSSIGQGASSTGAAAADTRNAASQIADGVGGGLGAVIEAVAGSGAGRAPLGNQRRNGFKCVVESVRQKLTLFSPDGVPLRATLSVTFREYRTLGELVGHPNTASPDRTHAHVVAAGDTLSAIANRYYGKAANWRPIADENEVEDPRRLRPGTPLTVPSLRP